MIRVFLWAVALTLVGLFAILSVMPAKAQDVASFDGTGCQLVPVTGQAYVAEVHCQNVETTGNAHSEGIMQAGGIVVGLTVDHGPGDVPDVFSFTPPDGYFADPPFLVLDEKTRGVVVVREWVGS